ncbi:uncharacterized protein LOC124363063 isoform X2 [Homalodisca vitripennis]|uniref:uncharacterized protein LOC124363063 isoform X2 n=1 Tax=Homalodisca vitripennis TaxID=197043 RepID=UPI001EE9D734|nr:uncharacterized protein LOC124363063 isoform X2 [Homalodisca vitripennis]
MMWSAAIESLIFLATFTPILGSRGEIFDITTVYDVGNICRNLSLLPIGIKGRVHVRTNAYGLHVEGIPESVGLLASNNNCDPSLECNWTKDGWSLEPSEEFVDMEELQVYSFQDPIKLRITNIKNNGVVFIFFTNGTSNLRDEEIIYLVKNSHSETSWFNGYEAQFYSQCISSKVGENHGYTGYNFEVKDRDGSIVGVHCSRADSDFNIDYTSIIYNRGDELYLQPLYGGDVLLTTISAKYISVYTVSHDSYVQFKIPVLSTEAQDSELTSPLINTDRVCLILAVHYGREIYSEQLQILTEDLSGGRQIIYTVHDAEAGWSVIRINKTLQTYQPIKIIIKTLDDTKVKIRLINICDAGGELVAILSSTSYGSSSPLSSLPVYKVHPDMLLTEPLQMPMPFTGDNCKNGGVFTSAGCACPPGFMGTLCETGCGQNRFGQDCGGVCSFRTKRCRGLALCSPFFKCACAPGYTGGDCNEQCSTGTYGNSCSQKCGHCLSGKPCDIYTGSCDDCELGYLTPQCSEASVYYSQKPALSYDDYRTLTVSFYPKNGTMGYVGYRNPKLYQIQYKEVGGEWRTYVNKMVPIKYHGEVAFLEDEVTEVIENLKDGVMYEIRVLFMDAKL